MSAHPHLGREAANDHACSRDILRGASRLPSSPRMAHPLTAGISTEQRNLRRDGVGSFMIMTAINGNALIVGAGGAGSGVLSGDVGEDARSGGCEPLVPSGSACGLAGRAVSLDLASTVWGAASAIRGALAAWGSAFASMASGAGSAGNGSERGASEACGSTSPSEVNGGLTVGVLDVEIATTRGSFFSGSRTVTSGTLVVGGSCTLRGVSM